MLASKASKYFLLVEPASDVAKFAEILVENKFTATKEVKLHWTYTEEEWKIIAKARVHGQHHHCQHNHENTTSKKGEVST